MRTRARNNRSRGDRCSHLSRRLPRQINHRNDSERVISTREFLTVHGRFSFFFFFFIYFCNDNVGTRSASKPSSGKTAGTVVSMLSSAEFAIVSQSARSHRYIHIYLFIYLFVAHITRITRVSRRCTYFDGRRSRIHHTHRKVSFCR